MVAPTIVVYCKAVLRAVEGVAPMEFLHVFPLSGQTEEGGMIMKGFVLLLAVLSLLLSGCVATAERLEAGPARPEKLIKQSAPG